jgi:phosphoribosylformylglycinamidine synthase
VSGVWQAEVFVTFKTGVLDPQGEAIRKSLAALGFEDVDSVRVGKYLQVRLASRSRAEAEAKVDEMCRKLLSNPVIEQYRFSLAECGAQPGALGR